MKSNFVYHRFLLPLVVAACLLVCSSGATGQSRVGIGDWQVHVPYRLGISVAEAGDRIYTASEQGLFYFDKEFNALETITKVDGLKEQRISAIRYDDATKTLVIGYTNTNVDLLRGDRIININDIFRKAITGEKTIHHIYIHNKLAYLSTTFGVVVLDLVKLEVKDTYSNLGPAGETVNVQATTTQGDSIYIATDLGVLAARYTGGTNLQDFKNWKNIKSGLPVNGTLTAIATLGDNVYAGTGGFGIYKRAGGTWEPIHINSVLTIKSLTAVNNHLVAAMPSGLAVISQNSPPVLVKHSLLQSPAEGIVGANSQLWVADSQQGLVKTGLTNSNAVAYTPNGPFASSSFRLHAANGAVYAMSGGFSESYLQNDNYEGFYVYRNGEWENFNGTLYPDQTKYPGSKDLVSTAYNPVTDKTYVASYGNGLIEWGGLGNFKLYNANNSPLLSALSDDDKTQYVRITDVAVDRAGDVWVVNRHHRQSDPGLHVLRKDKTWQSFTIPERIDWSKMDLILIDDNNQKWISLSRRHTVGRGIYVFDDKTMQTRHISTGAGNGNLPDGSIYSMALDLNGEVWVGTATGVAVFFNPGAVFSGQAFEAHIPIINRRPLLDGQVVRTIAVDGANRKWIGTDNGLWLFSPDGDEQIYHFTTRNSPLPSDKVMSVVVEHRSGEVFVATDAGIASFREGATITEGTPDCATVYPNPVRPDFKGMVGVSGLPNNASVRITDISGTLVYKTQALGGTVSWDGRNYNGQRVKAGVYLVMSADRDGGQSCISKIAILE